MSARRGFAPILIILTLIPIILLIAWAPWVTPNFAYKKIKATIKPPCEEFKPNLSSQFLGVAPPPDHKLIFGTEYFILVDCPSSDIPNGNNYFVSFLGTVHKLSGTPNSSWGVRSTATKSDKTVYTDKGSANWKTYSDGNYKFSIEYPGIWSIEGENTENINLKSSEDSTRFDGGANVEIYICNGGCGGSLGEGYPLIEKTDVVIQGHKATKLVIGDNSKRPMLTEMWINTTHNGENYLISLEGFHHSTKEVDQIISTFKFTN